MNIHFICRGNILRSLIAETYLKSLKLNNVRAISSGTNVDWCDPKEREYFNNTLALLDRHGIKEFAKHIPEQLVQNRIDTHQGVVTLMNQRVVDEARRLVTLPDNIQNWNITDIGEGNRVNTQQREKYEEEIYQEITHKVDALVLTLKTQTNYH